MVVMGSCMDIATTLGTSSAKDPHGARKVGISRDSIVIDCPPLPVVAAVHHHPQAPVRDHLLHGQQEGVGLAINLPQSCILPSCWEGKQTNK